MDRDRAHLSAQLRTHGDRLRAAQAADLREHEAIAQLLPHALAAGISRREIARLAGVGRPWIDKTLQQSTRDKQR